MLSAWIILATGIGGALAGWVFVLIGGTGVARELRRRIAQLETDIDAVDMKVMREIKRRASLVASEARAEDRSMKDLEREAARKLAEAAPAAAALANARPIGNGLPSMFRRG